jgi:hypothetical protein
MRHDEAETLPGLYCRDLESLHEPVERSDRKRRPANQVFGSFKSALDNVFWMTTLAITSPNWLSAMPSGFHIGSKFHCTRSTPTEMQSISENDFECFASTGVNTPLMAKTRRWMIGSWITGNPSVIR